MNQQLTTVQEDQFDVNLWGNLSTFWDYLMDGDRDLFENYWQGMRLTANALINKATRLLDALAPEQAIEFPIEDYYEIVLGPLTSKPLELDPTVKGNYIIRPLGIIPGEPQYDINYKPIYRDYIKISANDYYKIREIGLNAYVVVKISNATIPDQYFKINNLLSSEEPVNRKPYAEINYTLNTDGSIPINRIGTLAIEGLYYLNDAAYVDISQYKVQIITGTATSVVWGDNDLLITVDSESATQIHDIIVCSPTGTPWATLIQKCGAAYTMAPIFGGSELDEHAIRFNELASYKNPELTNDRFYQGSGNTWKWYDGYGTGTEGTVGEGEWIQNPSKNNYVIMVNGDLSYIGSNSFNIYLTTGRAYDTETYITDMPYLHTHISRGYPIEFIQGRDYTFENHIIEFNHDIFEQNEVSVNDILYCQKTPIVEHYLYEQYGNMIGVPDWVQYNHDGQTGRIAITSILQSIQDINTVEDYNRAVNAYYALPIAPQDGRVVGLYESYAYQIVHIDRDEITVDLKTKSILHPFIQNNGTFLVNNEHKTIRSVVDRSAGIIVLNNTSNLNIGDMLNLKLRNTFALQSVYAETLLTSSAITIYCPEGPGIFLHLIDLVYNTSNKTRYPEILIYNTNNATENYNGIYHIVDAYYLGDPANNIVKLDLYKKNIYSEPLYNDYIGVTVENIVGGMVHIPWPTHKFLYIQLNNGSYFKAYLDAPIDTIFDSEDIVFKYQVLARNASILTNSMFPAWYQFDQFKRYNGINVQSDVLEVTKFLQYAKFGKYFPSGYSMNIPVVPKVNILLWQNFYIDPDIQHIQKSYLTYNERGSGLPDMQNNYNKQI